MRTSISAIKKCIKYITNKKGERIAAQFNLKNPWLRQITEDLEGTIISIERYNDRRTSYLKAKKEIR